MIQRMKYRSRSEIVALILEAANGGATRTKIMYKAFLSFVHLKGYLSMLLENGLIEYEEGGKIYKTTPRGIRLLGVYNQINDELIISQPTSDRDNLTRY
jgi:predicted transcriptional regulator